MSVILAAVQTIAATPLPTITPSPSVSPVVTTVIQTVQVTPPWVNQVVEFVKQAALLLGIAIPGWLGSKVHSLVKKSKDGSDRFSQWQNAALLFGYSFIIAGLGLLADFQFNFINVDFASPVTYGSAFLVVLGAAAARYNRIQMKEEDAKVSPQVV